MAAALEPAPEGEGEGDHQAQSRDRHHHRPPPREGQHGVGQDGHDHRHRQGRYGRDLGQVAEGLGRWIVDGCRGGQLQAVHRQGTG